MDEEALFLELVEIRSPTEKEARLAAATQGNEALRRNLERLLKLHEQTDDFLRASPAAVARTIDMPTVAESVGTVIGPYKLLEQIGEGGFGIVFMAEQQKPVRRKVALKILKPGMDTKQVIARFEAERQALAIMDHPNIAKVHDGGATPLGRPFFVMELVKGVPITEYCDENHMPPRERLELFVSVCQAVQHAHQKGIIHRDLKPSNVLVSVHDTTPVVKVIDFGVAKALGQELTEKTLFTGFAQMVGTPLYMSPEQAGQSSLDVDTRSDIYSLGVMLYELLTGTTPFDRERFKDASYEEIRRIIREEEPARPSNRITTLEARAGSTISERRQSDPLRLSRLLRGELDWIVMKALEKDRNRRYETASALARDIQRYLADEPVQACPPSTWYRFRKFTRRNKTVLVVAGVTLFCIALVGGLGGWVVRDSAARQRQADDRVLASLTSAEPLLGEGRPWDPTLLAMSQRIESELQSGALGPAVRRRAEQLRQDVQMLVSLGEIRLRQSESRDTELFDSAGTDTRYAKAFTDYGLAPGALEINEAAVRVRNSAIRLALVAGLDAWMQVRPAQDRDWLRAVADGADDNAWRRTFREAALAADKEKLKALAGQPEALAQPPSVLAWLGSVLAGTGLTDEASAVLRQAQQRHPADFWLNYNRGHFLIFSSRQNHAQRHAEAVAYLRAAVAIRPGSAEAHSLLGIALGATGDLDGAIEAYQRAVALNPNFTTGHANLAGALLQKGDIERCITECNEAIRLEPGYFDPWRMRGEAYLKLGQTDKVWETYDRCAELNLKKAVPLRRRADFLIRCGLLKEVAADLARAYGLEEPESSLGCFAHALLRVYVEDHPGYRDACRRMLERFEDSANSDNWNDTAAALAISPESGVEPSRAVRLAERAVAHNKIVWRVAYLGMAYYRAGQLERARAVLEESLAIDPNWNPPWVHAALAMAQHRLGIAVQASAELEKAQSARDRRVEAMLTGGVGHWPGIWWDIVYGEVLCGEAYALIHGSPAPEDPRLAVLRDRALKAIGRTDE